uniref:hypothetical protein n=1 Tax=Pseudomonas fluorescens TaxID=294 RepID=UPI0018682492|nr:hypothetical protein [Pseudomonas fluorescens]
MHEFVPVAQASPFGYLMLAMAICFSVCAFFDYLEYALKLRAEKEGFSNPKLNEMMKDFRVWGMRSSTYSLVKAIAFTLMLTATLYAGSAAISNLLKAWFA